MLTDEELLRGLWWSDPEFDPAACAVWMAWVEEKHAFEAKKQGFATVLRHYYDAAARADAAMVESPLQTPGEDQR